MRGPVEARGKNDPWFLAALGALWLPFLWQLTPVWSARLEQMHGWAVPLLALYFANERARTMPKSEALRGTGRAVAWTMVALGLLTLPLWLTVLEANPGWPTVQWVTFAVVGTTTLALVAAESGLKRARHFVFPVLFVSTALSWPSVVMLHIVRDLAGFNAQLAAAVVSALGHPAVVSGNVIEVSRGLVGVDEACSGVRSLQAVWMAGWFFGELFLLRWPRRLALATSAIAAAVIINWIRTIALTWIAAADSPAASARWHDRAGEAELAVTLLAVAALAWWFDRRRTIVAMPENAPQQIEESDRRTRRGLLVAVMAGGLAAAAVPVLWYGYHENRTPGGRVSWRLASDETAWAEYAVPEKAAEILGADSIEAKTRPLGPTGAQAYALVVRWSGVAENALASEYHDPSICLPAAGMGVALAAEPFSVDVDGVKIDFSQGRFTSKEGGQHVFYCHWDAWLGRARGAQGEAEDDVTGWRWGRVKMGRRHGDVAYLAFVVPLGDEREAQAWLREWAPRLLRRT